MNKTTKKTKISVLLLIVACMVLVFTACKANVQIMGLSDYRYADPEKYLIGEADLTEKVDNIDIDWAVGSVTVMPHKLNTVCFSEKSERQLTDDTKLHYWLNGTTLRIRICGCGKWDFSQLKKDLTILVPETLIISNLKVNTLSANANLSNLAVTQLVKINTVSGDVKAKFLQPLNEFDGSSTSGEFLVSVPSVVHFDVNTVSGVVNLLVQKEPDQLNIDTTSGDISLTLPENTSFTLDYDTTSGDLLSDLNFRKSQGKYVFGDGKGEYEISTISGDVRVNRENNGVAV